MKSGSEVFKYTKERVLESSELRQQFKAGLDNIPHSVSHGPVSDVPDAVLDKVYTTLVKKMLHTINNDFLKNVSLLNKIVTGKRTDAKLLL